MLLFCLLLTFPGFTFPANQTIDGSWEIGLNLAAANHLVFGRDIIFNYGPLGFVFFPMDIGSNLVQSVAALVLLEVFFLGALALVLQQLQKRLDIVLVGGAWTLVGLRLFNIGIPMMVAAYLVLSFHRRQLRWAIPAVFVAAFSLLGKFNGGVGNAILLAAWGAAMLATERRWAMVLRLGALAGLYLAVVLLLYRLSGNPLGVLPDYLKLSWLIAACYSSAMCCPAEHHKDLGLAGALIGFVLWAAWRCYRRHPDAMATALLAIPVFFAFKTAVVRPDMYHLPDGRILGATLLGLLLCLAPRSGGRLLLRVILVLTLIVGFRLVYYYPPSSILDRASQAVAAFKPHENSQYVVSGDFNGPVPQMPEAWRQLVGRRTVDIYPWDLWLAYVNHLNWKPRLVLTSLSAYDPVLDRRSADHYVGADAPDFVLYRHYATDEANPCLVDPQTWLEIVRQYDFVDRREDLFLLERRPKPSWAQEVVLKTESVPLDRTIPVADRFPGRVALRAQLQLTAAGRLAEALYKVDLPHVVVTYETGEAREYRLFWRNLAGGFLVSDLPWEPAQAQEFFLTGRATPVREIRFVANETFFAKDVPLTWVELR